MILIMHMNHCDQCVNCMHRFSHIDKQFSLYANLQDNSPNVEYTDLRHVPSTVLYWGQLKLLMSELLFLEPYKKCKNVCVVYFGSSPGHHLKILVDLMPNTWQWRLYDENPSEVFCNDQKNSILTKTVKKNNMLQNISITRIYKPNVQVFEFSICEREAEILNYQSNKFSKMLCISDIRTWTDEQNVMNDMLFQMKIVEIIKPYQASLKFKLPYSDDFPADFEYLNGLLVLQCFKKSISHECRLFTLKGKQCMQKTTYNKQKYINFNYYFQTQLRTSLYFDNDQICNKIDHPFLFKYGVASDHCYDCTCVKNITQCFFETENVMSLLENMVKQLASIQEYCGAYEAKTKKTY